MKTYMLLLLVLVLRTVEGFCQRDINALINNRVTINGANETITLHTAEAEHKVRTQAAKTYSWYSAGRLHATQGGYSGKLLHGSYTSWYLNKNLKEKGEFKDGLRHGEWNRWKEDGVLKEAITWRNGVKEGRFSEYDDSGKLVKIGTYRNGLLSGKMISVISQDSSSVTYYREGKLTERRKPVYKWRALMSKFGRKEKQKGDSNKDSIP